MTVKPSEKPADVAFSRAVRFDLERLIEIRLIVTFLNKWLVIPLFPMLCLYDLFYMPETAFLIFPFRMMFVPIALGVILGLKAVKTYQHAQMVALLGCFITAILIVVTCAYSDGPDSVNQRVLNLLMIAAVAFVPWQVEYSLYVLLATYGPYFLYAIPETSASGDISRLFLNATFFLASGVIAIMVHFFHHKLKQNEFNFRQRLADEIAARDLMIDVQSAEVATLKGLSRQFSPQIVKAIAGGQITLDAGVHRSKICAVFVDIINSTARINRIDKDDLNIVISRFMDDSLKTMIKYDLTIDKFLGDGILAFANDPLPYPDYVERSVLASLEIIRNVEEMAAFYEDHWLQKFQLRVGIATGYANVGFYGTSEIFRTYTAIGPVVNLAARLSAVAKPNTIVVSKDVKKVFEVEGGYRFNDLGNLTLKGFDQDLIKGYELIRLDEEDVTLSFSQAG